MFILELDLHLYFEPPMTDAGDGIVLTRTLELSLPITLAAADDVGDILRHVSGDVSQSRYSYYM